MASTDMPDRGKGKKPRNPDAEESVAEAVALVDRTDAANLLRELGWRQAKDMFDPDNDPRPLLTYGDHKAIVGRTWTTFYAVYKSGTIEDVTSVRTRDRDALTVMGKAAL